VLLGILSITIIEQTAKVGKRYRKIEDIRP
jgi:hypothetical protein